MIYIEPQSTDAAFHFSVEEYIASQYPWNVPVMMIWQADGCAMLGCHQVAEAEIDIGYARKENIQIVRRSSGGGTIFTDMGTLLYTMILPHTKENYPLEIAKAKLATPIVTAMNKMGIPAMLEGRNDILIEGKKISGLAQYVKHGKLCVHGSLLYDTDLEKLTQLLLVDDEKILSKALRSVRSRVTNIKDHIPHSHSTQEFWSLLKQSLFCEHDFQEYQLSEHDLVEINNIFLQKYANDSWTFGRSPKFTYHRSKRFTGGKIEVFLDIVKGQIASCSIKGDFINTLPIQDFESLFIGKLFQCQSFEHALEGVLIQQYLGTITKQEFLSCIFG
jgi:lipoate-protein ligase A